MRNEKFSCLSKIKHIQWNQTKSQVNGMTWNERFHRFDTSYSVNLIFLHTVFCLLIPKFLQDRSQ